MTSSRHSPLTTNGVKPVLFLVLILVVFIATATIPKNEGNFVSSRFKAPHSASDPAQVQAWQQADATLWNYVNEHVPAVLDHTGSTAFDEHLKGVQSVLRYWNAPIHLTHAGLFHSIYGTEGFQGFSLPLSERPAIQKLIGDKAERLCFVFCMVDRSTVDETVFAWKESSDVKNEKQDAAAIYYTFRARPELGRFDITLTKEEWIDFIELTLADWLEQVEGASTKPSSIFLWKTGESYAYRRLAYRKMSEILAAERSDRLSSIPKQMLQAVMSTETKDTRHLVQARTPPMSDATARAYDALRANGEPIPVDFSPQPDEILVGANVEL
ncbi:MAG: hypothetical protein SGILL_009420 [Bacillariaceae sp.]